MMEGYAMAVLETVRTTAGGALSATVGVVVGPVLTRRRAQDRHWPRANGHRRRRAGHVVTHRLSASAHNGHRRRRAGHVVAHRSSASTHRGA